jgi:hypothetical protein
MELSLECEFFVIKLAQNWWYKDSGWHESRTCFHNKVQSHYLIHFMVCMHRLNLYFISQLNSKFLFSSIGSTITDLSNFNTILSNLHILLCNWWYNTISNFYSFTINDMLLCVKIQFDSGWHHTFLIWNSWNFSFLASLWFNQIYNQFPHIKRCWHAFV